MFKNRLSFISFTALLLIISCNGSNLKNDLNIQSFEKSKVNTSEFIKTDLKTLILSTTLEKTLNPASSFLVGDISGDTENEIVIINKSELLIYDLQGSLIKSAEFEGLNFGEGLLADIDEDSKLDILLGAVEEKGVKINGYNGVLEPAFDFTYSKIYNAETKLHFYFNNHLYFTSSSSLAIPPKITGAFNVETEELTWEYFTGPVADDVAADNSFSYLTISNTPKSANGLVMDDRTVSDHSKHHAYLYVLDTDGQPQFLESLGPEFRAGELTKDGISSVIQRIFDIDGDGENEIVLAISRVSELYEGKSVLEVYSLKGDLKYSKEFHEKTELDLSFYNRGKMYELAILENQKRIFSLLDYNLNTIREWSFPEDSGVAVFHESGDFNGDGKIEYLLSLENHLYILNNKLKLIFSTALGQTVKKAALSMDKSNKPVLIALTDKLYIFQIGEELKSSVTVYTNPPGVEILIDGVTSELDPINGVYNDLNIGTVTFQAFLKNKASKVLKTKLEQGIHQILRLEIEDYIEDPLEENYQRFKIENMAEPLIPLLKWDDITLQHEYAKDVNEAYYYKGYADFAGDESKDFLFFDKESLNYNVYDNTFNLLSSFTIPVDTSLAYISGPYPDVNNDFKSDLLVYSKNSAEYSIYSASGELLKKHTIGRFPNNSFNGALNHNGSFYLQTGSGYAQQPRGIFGVDLETSSLSFFYPTASQPTGLLITENKKMMVPIHTLSNGGQVNYDDGKEALDTEYFIHISDLNGNPLEQSYNPLFEENNGTIFYYSSDLDGDGIEEIYMLVTQSSHTEITRKIARKSR